MRGFFARVDPAARREVDVEVERLFVRVKGIESAAVVDVDVVADGVFVELLEAVGVVAAVVVRVDAKAVVQRGEVIDAQFVLRDGELGVIVAACFKRDGFAIDVRHDAESVAVFRHA